MTKINYKIINFNKKYNKYKINYVYINKHKNKFNNKFKYKNNIQNKKTRNDSMVTLK